METKKLRIFYRIIRIDGKEESFGPFEQEQIRNWEKQGYFKADGSKRVEFRAEDGKWG